MNITYYKRKIESLKKQLKKEREGSPFYNDLLRRILTNKNCILKLRKERKCQTKK